MSGKHYLLDRELVNQGVISKSIVEFLDSNAFYLPRPEQMTENPIRREGVETLAAFR
jgi:hypothetical protein